MIKDFLPGRGDWFDHAMWSSRDVSGIEDGSRFRTDSFDRPWSHLPWSVRESAMAHAMQLEEALARPIDVATDFPATIDVATLDGTNGFRIDGAERMDRIGSTVSAAGDVNGDGIDDFLIWAYPGANSPLGQGYVLFGTTEGFPATLNLASLDGSNGFYVDGTGKTAAAAGDINGDGIDDIIVGARNYSSGDRGEAFVIFGTTSGFDVRLDLGDLKGDDGFRIKGGEKGDNFGNSVSSAGDINGDGYDDLVIGAHHTSPAGATYVVFGKPDSFEALVTVSTLDGANGFKIIGIDQSDLSGISVSSAGDVNGDGIDDIIIGALNGDIHSDPEIANVGESYVVFGKTTGWDAVVDLGKLDGSNGFRLTGIDENDRVAQVSSAGDINGDGYDDIVIGGASAGVGNSNITGEAYVVFGKATGWDANISLDSLDGNNGFRIKATDGSRELGATVSSAGDINGDGYDDIIVSAPLTFKSGEAYVIFGKSSGWDADFQLTGLSGDNGFRLILDEEWGDLGGGRSAGDVNGDGFADIILGAPQAYPRGDFDAGSSFVIFGRAPDAAVIRVGSDADQVIRGGRFDDTLLGLGGEDTLYGGRGGDHLFGGNDGDHLVGDAGDDYLVGQSGGDQMEGGAGTDSLYGGDGDDLLFGDGENDILAGQAGEDTISGGTGDDRLFGGADDDLLLGDDGDDYANGEEGDDVVSGFTGNDRLYGRQGEDTINGDAGNDRLYGNGRNDVLDGGSGRDTLIGGNGNDTLSGGTDKDRFVFRDNSGLDTITDFETGTDRISLFDYREENGGDALTIDQLLITQIGTVARIELDLDRDGVADDIDLDGDGTGDVWRIDLSDTAAVDITSADFIF